MKRGQRPKPTALLKLQGTYHPSRHDRRGPEPETPGELADLEPPLWMSDRQQQIWREIVERAPLGILRTCDYQLLTEYVELVDRHRAAVEAQAALDQGKRFPFINKGPNGQPVESVYLDIINKSLVIMLRMKEHLGFTPSARAQMSIDNGVARAGMAPDPWVKLRRFPVVDGGKKDDDAA